MGKSKIEWTQETWSPFIGCTPVSPGCENCWARREEDGRFRHLRRCHDPDRVFTDGGASPYKDPHGRFVDTMHPYFALGPVYQGDKVLERPLHWRKGQTIFVCSRSDLFHEDISDEQIDRVFAVMALCPQHKFLVLTKRAERMAEYSCDEDAHYRIAMVISEYLNSDDLSATTRRHMERVVNRLHGFAPDEEDYGTPTHVAWPLPNVGLGVTVCNQAEADAKIPLLLGCPAAMRFVSIEPCLGDISIDRWLYLWCVFCGSDSEEGHFDTAPDGFGRKCRDCGGVQPNFATEVRTLDGEQFEVAAVHCVIVGCESGKNRRPCMLEWVRSVVEQCKAAGVPCFVKQLDIGGKVSHEPADWPEDLRVRELPAQLKGAK